MEDTTETPKLSALLTAYFKGKKDQKGGVDPDVIALLEAAKKMDQTVETLTAAVDEANAKIQLLERENQALMDENDALEEDLEVCEDKLRTCKELVEVKVKRIEEMLTQVILHILRGENKFPPGYEIDHEFRFFAEDYLSHVGCNEKEKNEALRPTTAPGTGSPCPSPPFR